MILVGLTGGIASGKTLVSDHLATLGARVIDADQIARDVVAKGSEGLKALVDAFSNTILTSECELDRAALRALVFAQNDARKRLDGIVHPLIRLRSDALIEKARRDDEALLVYAVPLLVETRQQQRFDRIIVVDVPRSVQRQRLLSRDGGAEKTADGILNAQASRLERLSVASYRVDNSGSKADALTRTEDIYEALLVSAQLSSANKASTTP